MATSANEGFDIRRARTPPGPSGNQHSGAIVAECSAHDISLCLLVSLPFIEPCRPKPVKRLPTGEKWSHEPKLDGWCLQTVTRGKDVALYSRHGREFTQRFPVIAEAIAKLPCRSATMDGELVLAAEGRTRHAMHRSATIQTRCKRSSPVHARRACSRHAEPRSNAVPPQRPLDARPTTPCQSDS